MLVTLFGMVTRVKPLTTRKGRTSNARNAVRYGHTGQTGATIETQNTQCYVTLLRYANAGQAATTDKMQID